MSCHQQHPVPPVCANQCACRSPPRTVPYKPWISIHTSTDASHAAAHTSSSKYDTQCSQAQPGFGQQRRGHASELWTDHHWPSSAPGCSTRWTTGCESQATVVQFPARLHQRWPWSSVRDPGKRHLPGVPSSQSCASAHHTSDTIQFADKHPSGFLSVNRTQNCNHACGFQRHHAPGRQHSS